MGWWHYPDGSEAPPYRGRFDPEHGFWGLVLAVPLLFAPWPGPWLYPGLLGMGLAIYAAGSIVHRTRRARLYRTLRAFRRERDGLMNRPRASTTPSNADPK